MRRIRFCGLMIVSSALGVAAASPMSPPASAPAPRAIPFAELVKQLGSEEFAEREAATKRLSAMALAPPPELLAAAESDDPDLRQRARNAILKMRENLVVNRLPRGEGFATSGRVDLFVAATAAWDLKAHDPRLWEPPLALSRVLVEKANMTGERKLHDCPAIRRNFVDYRASCNPRFTRVNEVYRRKDPPPRGLPVSSYYPEAIQSLGVLESQTLTYNVLVVRGDVEAKGSVSHSVIFANGNLTTQTVSQAVIVCDGDVIVGRDLHWAVVIASGNIVAREAPLASVLIAGGKIELERPRLTPKGFESVMEEGVAKPLDFVTFFELSAVGVEVKVADKAVRVAAVADGKAFAAAGVKVGDVVAEVNGKKPDSAESLRRLLRDALAVGDATLTLRRGDKTETIKVSLPE